MTTTTEQPTGQDLAEEHRSLRRIMGVDGWGDGPSFD